MVNKKLSEISTVTGTIKCNTEELNNLKLSLGICTKCGEEIAYIGSKPYIGLPDIVCFECMTK